MFLATAVSPGASPTPAAVASGSSTLPVLDGVIVLVLLVALVIGYQKGIITPLMTYLFFFGSLFLIYRDRTAYLNGVEKYLHLNIVLAIFFALLIGVVAGYIGSIVGQALHRMPIARGIDGFLGIFLNVAISLAAIYFVLSGLITLDKAFTPILNSAKLTQAQVTTLNKVIQSNPLAVALIDPNDLKKLQDQAKKGQQASLDSVTELNNLKSFYEDFIRPQLKSSKVAPYVMRVGQRIPLLGHYGPNDLPK